MDTIKLFKQFKLGDSLFTGQYKLDKHDSIMQRIPPEETERVAVRQMVDQLSNLIISKRQSAITKKEDDQFLDFRCQLLVLKMEDFKTIVEAAIQMMPNEAIEKIRNGNPIY